MSDLVEFLRARLDEDEWVARAAGAGTWTRECDHVGWDGEKLPPSHDTCCVVAGDDIRIYDEGGHDPEQANHIARWDPTRVLAEVEAKRDILDEAELMIGMTAADPDVRDHVESNRWMWKYDILWPLVRVYADHPDFNPAWAPGAEEVT
jgi:Family of unknown function (DUF6221)